MMHILSMISSGLDPGTWLIIRGHLRGLIFIDGIIDPEIHNQRKWRATTKCQVTKDFCLFQNANSLSWIVHLFSLLSINFKKWMNNWCCNRRVSGLRVSVGRANLPSMQGGKFPLKSLKSTNYRSDLQLITSNIHSFRRKTHQYQAKFLKHAKIFENSGNVTLTFRNDVV